MSQDQMSFAAGFHSCEPVSSDWSDQTSREITRAICETYSDDKGINHIEQTNLPQHAEILDVLRDLLEILFPGYTGAHNFTKASLEYGIGSLVNGVFCKLNEQVTRSLQYYCRLRNCAHDHCGKRAQDVAIHLLREIPKIREQLKDDVMAAMAGDPAAYSQDEIVISYPGLKAIAIYRLAHVLYKLGVPFIPRVMTEHAHHETGIDIHPGATIGRSFFIDHGTGVVIGETATIGENVKIYQGVTLGALSFPTDEHGNAIRGRKRHPSIEDNVTIYAGATILGDVVIGHDSVIGGNVWLMSGIEPYTQVTIDKPKLSIKKRKSE